MTKETTDTERLARQIAATAPSEAPSRNVADLGHYGIRIARDGTWLYRGSPIARKELVRLFASVLHRDNLGRYWLVTPVERGRIDVDDAPFTAVDMHVAGAGRDRVLSFRTNVDDIVTAGDDHPIRVDHDAKTGEPAPYILVRDDLEALITRAVFYELADLAEPGESGAAVLGVWSKGRFFELGAAGAA